MAFRAAERRPPGPNQIPMHAPAIVSFERPGPAELSALFVSLGWGRSDVDVLESSIRAYTATVCARAPGGLLVGYASVFSDRSLTTMFGEFVVHPQFQRQGLGKAMMRAVEKEFPSAPIYVKALGAAREFYAALGFRTSSVPLTSMFKRPPDFDSCDVPAAPVSRRDADR
jgi:GNAT superfamily N-acetyltransferase